MRKAKKNKKNRYYKKQKNLNNEDSEFFNFTEDNEFFHLTPKFMPEKQYDKKEDFNNYNIHNNDDNAAPFINPSNSNIKYENEEDDNLGPAMDMRANQFNDYIKSFNKRREKFCEIKLNNQI